MGCVVVWGEERVWVLILTTDRYENPCGWSWKPQTSAFRRLCTASGDLERAHTNEYERVCSDGTALHCPESHRVLYLRGRRRAKDTPPSLALSLPSIFPQLPFLNFKFNIAHVTWGTLFAASRPAGGPPAVGGRRWERGDCSSGQRERYYPADAGSCG